MTIGVVDCLDPRGELEAAVLWPGMTEEAVEEAVAEYLQQGYSKAAEVVEVADQDEAALQWVYYRAYLRKWKSLSGLPGSVSTSDEGSASYLSAQIQNWKDLADEALGKHEALIPPVTELVPVVMNRASESTRFNVEW